MPKNGSTDQTVKLRIVLATGVLALTGFFLEVGPVGGAFDLTILGLGIELPALGFLAYLALAASAAIGVRISETEPVAKEEDEEVPEAGETKPEGEGEGVREVARARVRPELHQFLMFITALGGYAVLKRLSLALMWPSLPRYSLTPQQLVEAFQFGFYFVALGWFVLWQFLRWIAVQRRWVRLQDELVGADITRIIAVVILIKPLVYFISLAMGALPPTHTSLLTLSILLHLTVVLGAVILWTARPENLRRTLIGLFTVSGLILILTGILAVVEQQVVG